ncbi:MAG: hypothetical protein NTX75_04235 [Proteobacteria bacterium]|nr:hypothetical protein [Pseudomonadota bacterium]
MNLPKYPALQYRWQIKDTDTGAQLVYFGLRNPPNHTKNIIPLPSELADSLRLLNGKTASNDLPSSLTGSEIYARLVSEKIVVEADKVHKPSSKEHYRECVRCVTNDYILPGLEFDENGLCAFCQCYEQAEKSGRGSLMQEGATDDELLKIAAENTRSRFDVMVLYTGGKDSTYLLWYLAKKLGLRVLVASWNMPYTNDTCRENMRRAMRLLPDTEFIERTMPWNVVRQAMHNQFEYTGLPCLCPMAAHALFYPLAAQEKIPVIMHGVEEVQLAVMNYVMTEIKSGQPQKEQAPDFRANTLNFLRLLTKQPVHAQPYALNADLFRYMPSVKKQLPAVYMPLDDIVAQAENNPDMSIPELRRLKTNTTYGSWAEVAELIKKEMDWQMPSEQKALLHTSCRIEKVKDYCQFQRFGAARSVTFPQSVVELGAGVYFGLISRQDALMELQETGYYNKPEILSSLLDDLGIDADRASGEIPWSLGRCAGCSQQGS